MIHLSDLNKTYQGAQPLHVLKGINLDIARGEFVSIMGASGSGKSTLLNILGILDNYDSGEYLLNNVLIRDLSETRAAEYRNKMIGFIFQSFNLISFKTAVENVELPLFYQGVGRRKRHQMAMEYLDRLGLAPWADHYPNEMSGGQKQRRTDRKYRKQFRPPPRVERLCEIIHYARTHQRNMEHVEAQQTAHLAHRFCRGMGHLHAHLPVGRRQRTHQCTVATV